MADPKKEIKTRTAKEVVDDAQEAAELLNKESKPSFRVSKIIVHPSRKVGLPNFSSVDLSAGMEIVFDTPQEINSQQIQDAFTKVHEVLQAELKKQFELFGTKKKDSGK